jgi:hypothetical protein
VVMFLVPGRSKIWNSAILEFSSRVQCPQPMQDFSDGGFTIVTRGRGYRLDGQAFQLLALDVTCF